MYWINYSHGMELDPINSQHEKRHNENGILFLVEYFIIKYLKNELTEIDVGIFNTITQNIQSYSGEGVQFHGLYDRGEGESLPSHEWYVTPDKRRDISHDNLTAIAVFSNFFKLPYAKHIQKHAIKWQFRFDNCYPENPRWIQCGKWHPRDWFFYLYCGDGFWKLFSYPLFPIYFGACIVSACTKKSNTSGKLLWFVRLALLKEKSLLHRFTWFFYKRLLKKKYGDNWLSELASIYMGKDHPIYELSKDLKL